MASVSLLKCNAAVLPAAVARVRLLGNVRNAGQEDLLGAEKSLLATLVVSKGLGGSTSAFPSSKMRRKILPVVQACARCGDVMRAEAWLATLTRTRLPLGVRVFNAMLLACARAEDLARAEWWLFDMIGRDIDPNVFSFNLLLNAASEARDVNAVEKWFSRMSEAVVAPDKVTYRTAIAAAARNGNAPLAEEWLSRMQFARHAPDVISYTSIIGAHASSGHAAGAEQWLHKMLDEGLKADQVGYNQVIGALAVGGNTGLDQLLGKSSEGHPERAEAWMWKALEAGVEPSKATMHKLLASFVRAEDFAGVERVQGVMHRLGQWPTAAAYAILARPHAAAGDFEAVEALLTELQDGSKQPDIACMRVLLTAYARAPQPPRAKAEDCVQQLQLLGAFSKKNLEADQHQFLKDLRQALGKKRYYELASFLGIRSTLAINDGARHRIVGRCVSVEPA